VLLDACVSRGGCARAPEQGANGGAAQRSCQHQPGEEADTRAGHDVGHARERLAVEGKRAVGVTHDNGNVFEDEVLTDLAGAPPEVDDLVADLVGPCHVVISDGPQMRGAVHGPSSLQAIFTARRPYRNDPSPPNPTPRSGEGEPAEAELPA